MSCYNPMIAVNTGRVNPETGKKEYKFLKSLKHYNVDEQMRRAGEPEFFDYSEPHRVDHDGFHDLKGLYRELAPVNFLVDEKTGEVFNRAVVLPCGQCLGCRTAYAAQWADRIMLESFDHEKSYFVTLTYDELHVPRNIALDGETVLTLCPKDMQDFLKRLRRQQSYHYEIEIRFYGVGEYGSLKHRPHYHIIIFGLYLDDLYELGRNKTGRMLHSSKVIEKLWPYGRVEVDELTWESAAYTARYTVKKLGKVETDFYKEHNLVPEFSRMSLKPGIGQKYFDDNAKTIYEYDKIHIPTSNGVRTVKPPRFYDSKYDDIDPTGLEEIKSNRKEIARQHVRTKMQNYSGSYFELLEAEERAFKARTKSLRRELEDG